MALAKLTTKKINRTDLSATKSYLFNTDQIAELKADSNDSIFYYTRNPKFDRESFTEYKVDETKATVDALIVGYDVPLSLPALKKKVGAKIEDYAQTITIHQKDVGFGWADPDDAAKSWLEVYSSAFSKVTYQVNLSLDQLSGVANILTYKFLDSLNSAFTGGDRTGTIDYAANTIAIAVPAATTVTALVASFTLSTGASAKVSSTLQVSGTTTNNFTSPVAYVVTAANGSTRTFTVTVTIES
jgi:hypothetical protein